MAKKLRKRTWWFPFFESEKKKIELRKIIGDTDAGEMPILFDDPNVAYGFMAAKRLEVYRDENDEVVLNNDGYAKLKNEGKIHVIAFDGKHLNWKNIEVMPGITIEDKHTAIVSFENIGVNQQTVKKVFEESDELFNRFANTPLAQAGGVKPIEASDPTDASGSSEPSAEGSNTAS